jgi:hypothetical protein
MENGRIGFYQIDVNRIEDNRSYPLGPVLLYALSEDAATRRALDFFRKRDGSSVEVRKARCMKEIEPVDGIFDDVVFSDTGRLHLVECLKYTMRADGVHEGDDPEPYYVVVVADQMAEVRPKFRKFSWMSEREDGKFDDLLPGDASDIAM